MKNICKDKQGWDVLVDDKTNKVLIECKKQQSGFMSMRSTGPMNFSPKDIWRTINYCKMRPEWDINQVEIFIDSKIGVNATRLYCRTRKIAVVSSREFLAHCLTYVDKDGTVYNIAVSPDSDPEFERKQ